jgi:flagellar hook protein FlgE
LAGFLRDDHRSASSLSSRRYQTRFRHLDSVSKVFLTVPKLILWISFARRNTSTPVKSSHRLLFLVFLTSVCSVAETASLLAQSAILEANRNLSSSGAPAAPPGARKPGRLPIAAVAGIDLGNGQSATVVCHKGSFDRVGLHHDQTVDITMQYSNAVAGQTVTVDALDGGQIIAPAKNLTIATDGTIHFKFRVGHQPGVYQIALHNGTQELGLQFWVFDEEHPRNNPPVVNPHN